MQVSRPRERVAGMEVAPFGGWPRCLHIWNEFVTVVATLDVGPRIISYSLKDGISPLHLREEQAGGSGEPDWKIRGGHRLWIAPENRATTYHPDNSPVAWNRLGELSARLTPGVEKATGFQKEIDLTLQEEGPQVIVTHRITRTDSEGARIAVWGLSALKTGGVALLPQPPAGEHPRDLLPNRRMILWPYTDLGDHRWKFGSRFVRIESDPMRGPTKVGLADPVGWSAYLWDRLCFVKRYPFEEGAEYPDSGCNLEVFTNQKMLELESLGPLVSLAPGETVEHSETWSLHRVPASLRQLADDPLSDLLSGLAGKEKVSR